MGCTVREKYIRTNRRARSAKPDNDQNVVTERTPISNSIMESALSPLNYRPAMNNSNQTASPNPNFDDSGWGYCTEEQLEESLLKNLELLYNEAISKLVSLGYDEDVALKAILRNGHCYGGMDVLTNIFYNSLAYLNTGGGSGGGSDENLEGSNQVFADLRQLEEYSLAGMVCMLQQIKPHLSKGDAMWCLLMSDLHVGRACVMKIPVSSPSNNGCNSNMGNMVATNSNVENVIGNNISPALCRFHGGWGFRNGSISEFPMNGFFSDMTFQREIECPKRFNLTPSMKNLLRRNVAAFAAGFKANSKHFLLQSQACPSLLSTGDLTTESITAVGDPVGQKEIENSKSQDVVSSVVSKFQDLNLDENAEYFPEDQKDEMILSLIHQIKDLERQVKERRDWAHEKAIQAARKLSNDLREIKMLRLEREETQRLKKGKQTLEDNTMKRLTEMENALRKASGQVDRANVAVRKLETENAEIRAEIEASKLSASESVTTCLEVAKREKKCLKKLLAWEKQKSKLQGEISAEKQKILELQQELVQVEASQKEARAKWRQQQKEKEAALAQVEEERRLKEQAEISNKRKLEVLRQKIELDFQRHKDDLQRLEQELSRLKASAQGNEPHHQSNDIAGNPVDAISHGETIARLLHELDKQGDSSEKEASHDRKCIICLDEDVSVVFLPCAHEVLCVNCNDNYGIKGKAICPCCRIPIEQRIRVFGASS